MPRIAAVTHACAGLCAIAFLLAAPAASAGAATGPAKLDRRERAVVVQINRERAANGLGALRTNHQLSRAADAHSADMRARRFFGHDSLGGPSWFARVNRYLRAREIGEVIGRLWRSGNARRPGPRTEAGRMVRLWMNSPPHRAVLLSPRLARLGVGRRAGDSQGGVETVYTVDFASRR
jgi:uncharacterized protein YkwD